MALRTVKSLLVAAFSLLLLTFSNVAFADQNPGNNEFQPEISAQHTQKGEGDFEPGKVIMEHIMDNHDFHLFDYNGHAVSIPLPVIVYEKEKGLSFFMSSKFEHGHAPYNGYKLEEGTIKALNADNSINEEAKVYDFSMTRNVVQMLIALTLLVWMLLSVAKKYKQQGAKKAPTGFQNALEPVITFIRDEVGVSNLGKKSDKYMPYLLTVFFFILICNIFGLIPGSANVTGNIAFTAVLGIISLIVILLSTNKHFWGHIFWYPGVPMIVRLFIMLPVELLGIFTKPFALIIRLFANMVAGHMIITCLVMMIFIFSKLSVGAGIGFAPVSMLFTIFIYLIEILVAFIQAFIFTNLTAVFIGQALEGAHDDEAHAHH
jgi:F-type H+-transporting ATPase subunit a